MTVVRRIASPVVRPLVRAINAAYGISAFTPARLFTTGVNGAWYDPSDLTTLYQDAAGTQPVTAVEQPVGLMLDKSKGLVLGSERAPAFANYDTVLTGTWAASGGNYAFTDTVGSQSRPGVQWPSASAIVGWYQVTVVVASITGATQIRLDGIGVTDRLLVVGTNTFVANITTSSRLRFRLEDLSTIAGDGFAITSVSVRELPGNHAFNSSGNSANFPVLSARYNLLTKTEQFDDAAWVKQQMSTTANAAVAPDGTTKADRVVSSGGPAIRLIGQTFSLAAVNHTFSVWVKAASASNRKFRIVANQALGSAVGTASSVFEATDTWQLFTYTTTGATGYWGITQATSPDFDFDLYIWGADLRVANDALNQPVYQRVNTATDYDTVGFKPYLRFNGTNQWLQTNSISFTYGDKMFVSAGVRKLSDAVQTVYELSANYASNSGSFSSFINGGGASTNTIDAGLKGSGVNTYFSSSSYGTPISYVHSVSHNIAGTNRAEEIIPRINGVLNQSGGGGATDTGGGMFGNYPLYIGSRAGTSVWFNGRLYQLVVAGKQASAAEITSTEAYINQKTGAY